MSQLRQDLTTRRWTIIAADRAKRPADFTKRDSAAAALPPHVATCPFCAGNEAKTPPPVYVFPELIPAGGHDWSVRVVPNRFPVLLAPAAGSDSRKRTRRGLYLDMEGCGEHEVVIEHPDHSKTIATMTVEEVTRVVRAYHQRFLELDKFDWNQLIIIFRNQGEGAGTSLVHPHSQIIGAPIVPQDVRCRLDEAQRYFDDNGTCVHCDMLEAEAREEVRVVSANPGFVAFCPYASAVPYEVRIVPRRHASSFGILTELEADLMARILKDTLSRLYVLLGNPDYNYVIRSAPHHSAGEPHFHWYLEILPRLTTAAGFEIGTGINVNVVAPEAAADQLRRAS